MKLLFEIYEPAFSQDMGYEWNVSNFWEYIYNKIFKKYDVRVTKIK